MNIVVPDDFPPTYGSTDQADLARLAEFGTVVLHTSRAADRAELFSRIAEAEVLLNVRSYTLLDDEALAHAPKLRMVSILGTGTDNVDLQAAKSRGVAVTNTPGVGAPSVAELTFALLLAVTRGIVVADPALRTGGWVHTEGPELDGKTLGVLGLGAIGQRVARLGQGFGMRVLAWSYRDDAERAARLGVTLVSKEDLLRQADVVSVHLRNTPEARGFVGQAELAQMKPTAILLNTARGALIDQDAVAAALRAGKLGGLGLDVYLEEPLPPEKNPFKDFPNVVLTPHIGAVTHEASARSRAMPVDNIIAFLQARPQHVVNP